MSVEPFPTPEGPQGSWPIWRRKDGYAVLARYVSPAAIRGLRLAAGRPGGHDPVEADRVVAERLYRRLRELQIDYADRAHAPLPETQFIRHPELIVADGVGTCLDLATMYASMCLDAQVGVLLALSRDHAFVLATPGRLHADPHPLSPQHLDGCTVDSDGVLTAGPGVVARALEDGSILAVDVVRAVADGGADFTAARAAARTWCSDHELHLVDVAWTQARTQFAPLSAPTTVPKLEPYSALPAGHVAFEDLRRDRSIVEQLARSTGTVVLLAPAGWGKSTIARRVVEQPPAPPAWLLDASGPETLTRGLAAAELAHRHQAAGAGSDADWGYAQSALVRLGEAPGRWIVVLDNADGDPTGVLRWMPQPGEDQLVLVTTTNEAWAEVPGVEVVRLPALEEHEVTMRLGGDELTQLTAGRPLLLDAFRRFLRASKTDPAALVRQREELQALPEQLRGPATLWAALQETPAFGARERQLSAYVAHLSPDRQPLATLELLVPGAGEAAQVLAEHGLVSLADEHVSMHRLFGAAIRADLAARDPQLSDEAVRRIATEPAPRALIDARGDLGVISEMEQRLMAVERDGSTPDPELGLALHGVAGLLELHGQTIRSARVYERAQPHLAERYPALIADCLQGRAREVNQHHGNDEQRLREAIEWARTARQILIAERGEDANADRCLAMEGLLLQKLARFAGTPHEQLQTLQQALVLLETADERRERRPDVEEVELARSRFNLAGIHLQLAKRDTEHAAEHLDAAYRTYYEVRERRRKMYGRTVHPHVAACDIGLGYVDYHRAALLRAGPAQRSAWLRSATHHASTALQQRDALEGPVDLEEVNKAATFLSKVALARAASPVAMEEKLARIAAEARAELLDAQILFAPLAPLPSRREGLVAAIERWVRAPALRAVVAEYAREEPPWDAPLGTLLAWLEEFSIIWDFRRGAERNLVRTPEIPRSTANVVLTAAQALGLRGAPTPPQGRYDHVLILGGLVRACLARPQHAAWLLRRGEIETSSVTALGGFRPIAGDEVGLVERVTGERVDDELHAMDAGVRAAFDVGQPVAERGEDSELVGASWRVREYLANGKLAVRVVAAPSSEPGTRRANTPDTYAWFATELAQLEPGQRILVVTTEIYVPYQHADALRMLALPYGVEVDAAGVNPGATDPALAQSFRPHNYLQEIRSAIRALRALHTALDVQGGGSDA